MGHRLIAVIALLTLLAWPAAGYGGQQCDDKALSPDAVRKALQLAAKTRDVLDQTDATVALVGRVGADLSAHGLRYSHAGIAQRDHPRGRWLVTHLLNHCGSDRSGLFIEGLGNFFLDDPFAYEAILLVPSPEAQRRLLAVLASRLPFALYTAEYSMIANPFSTRYQNSNQWLLELVVAGLAPEGTVASRAQAQQWLRLSGYTGSTIRITPLQRVGARLFRVNVRFDDHDAHAAQSGRYPVVSVESVLRLVAALDPNARSQVVGLH
jgi:hypothetical protein